ncbi:hypothetical protein D3C71_1957640 [compost metagenome]
MVLIGVRITRVLRDITQEEHFINHTVDVPGQLVAAFFLHDTLLEFEECVIACGSHLQEVEYIVVSIADSHIEIIGLHDIFGVIHDMSFWLHEDM